MSVNADSIRNLPNHPPTDIELVMAFLTYYKIRNPTATRCEILETVGDWSSSRLADLKDELIERGFEVERLYAFYIGDEYLIVKW